MFCKNCGKEIREDSQFCWNCGTKIEIKKDEPVTDSIKKPQCKNCGNDIYEKADVCPHCGIHLRIVIIKNPGLASVLSFFIPGLGQIYNGEIIIGIAFLVIEILLAGVGLTLVRTLRLKEGIAFILICLIFWAYNVYSAYKIAERDNKKKY